MYELKTKMETYLRVNLLGPRPRLIKKNLLGRGLTKLEKHWSTELPDVIEISQVMPNFKHEYRHTDV